MKKIFSLLKASLTSDMQIFKIKTKNNSKSKILIPLILSLCLMFSIWSNVNLAFEKTSYMHMQTFIFSLYILLISFMTIIEGIYKTGSLLYNSKDDDLLFSLPLKKQTILFVRIFKFYIFELLFNSLFLLPLIISYIRWAENINWTFYLTSVIMFIILPIIPIIISSIIGAIINSISSKFKNKNAIQIIMSMLLLVIVLYGSFNIDSIFNYIIKNSTSLNNLITKIYYPAGVYANLITKFNIGNLLLFIIFNIILLVIMIYFLSKFYFKLNSNLKSVFVNKKIIIKNSYFKNSSQMWSLIKKEFTKFFCTPVLIINAGFSLLLFLLLSILIIFKYDTIVKILSNPQTYNLSISFITQKKEILVLLLISVASYMTSITNSLISLEGKNISILKSLPVSSKTILMSKIYASLLITSPVLIVGDILLFIKLKINIISAILLIILSILVPLVSHFIGLIINLKYPKLDAENSTEVVKQSASSFISVMMGMLLLIISSYIILKIMNKIGIIILLLILIIVYIIIDLLLYFYLNNKGVKDFNSLSI